MESKKTQQVLQGMGLGLAIGISIGVALGEWYWSLVMGASMAAAFSQVFITNEDDESADDQIKK